MFRFARFADSLKVLLDFLLIRRLEGAAVQRRPNFPVRTHFTNHLMILPRLSELPEIFTKLLLLRFGQSGSAHAGMKVDCEPRHVVLDLTGVGHGTGLSQRAR